MAGKPVLRRFDTGALYTALDAQRTARGLSWTGVAREFWELDAALNRHRPGDHPFSATTIKSMAQRHRTSCQHALFMCRWLGMVPEHFLDPPSPGADRLWLPDVPEGRRLRWSLTRLHVAADRIRTEKGLTWQGAAAVLACQPNQLTGLRTAKFATGIDLAMRIAQWTQQPSTEFMYFATW